MLGKGAALGRGRGMMDGGGDLGVTRGVGPMLGMWNFQGPASGMDLRWK